MGPPSTPARWQQAPPGRLRQASFPPAQSSRGGSASWDRVDTRAVGRPPRARFGTAAARTRRPGAADEGATGAMPDPREPLEIPPFPGCTWPWPSGRMSTPTRAPSMLSEVPTTGCPTTSFSMMRNRFTTDSLYTRKRPPATSCAADGRTDGIGMSSRPSPGRLRS